VPSGPIVIGYDGSPASERAIRDSAELLAPRPAVVVVAWKPGLGFELVELPTSSVGLPPLSIDIGRALEIEDALFERAQRLAEKGAGLARDAGYQAEALVVADDPDVPIADTIVRVARERDAPALVVGAHGHGRLGETPGSVARRVVRQAPCPVVLVRAPDE
jgi:nucleotide-binding universal stress UspA family protein